MNVTNAVSLAVVNNLENFADASYASDDCVTYDDIWDLGSCAYHQ